MTIKIQDLPFITELELLGADLYTVGGSNRNHFLDIPPKDLDILVGKLELDKILEVVKKYGHADTFGAKFKVIKWKAFGSNEEIDIALPRTERRIGPTRNDFEIISDPFLPIEQDLYRRDFTCNAIAIKLDGTVIDPFGGVKDIENKVIRMINPDTFDITLGDELRMIRAIGQASRLNFDIEPVTFNAIKENAHNVTNITKDRIVMEFEKIVSEGNPIIAMQLLKQTDLYKHLFNENPPLTSSFLMFAKSVGEFLFLIQPNMEYDFKKWYDNLDTVYLKEITALRSLSFEKQETDIPKLRYMLHKAFKIFPNVLNSNILQYGVYKGIIDEFKNKLYPISLNELDINGNQLMELGYKGKELGEKLDILLKLVYEDKIKNEFSDLFSSDILLNKNS